MLSYLPAAEYRSTSENLVTTTTASGVPFGDNDRRFQLTGERDFSREPSFLHHSAGGLRDLPLTHSTPERNRSDGINNYGYDVHEIQTTGQSIFWIQIKFVSIIEGGARIVQSHGSGFIDASPLQNSSLLMHDRSLDTTIHNQSGAKTKEIGKANLSATNSEQLHSILKTSDDFKKYPADER